MDFDLLRDPRTDCCHLRIAGTLRLADYEQVFRTAWSRREYTEAKRALWDFTAARARFGKDEIKMLSGLIRDGTPRTAARAATLAARRLADFTRRERPSVLPARVALVAAQDLDFGMMRVYAGHVAFYDVATEVFRASEDALGWLLGP
ncbi:MAG: hypothetical protein H6977_02455 [Gammaproteobacteria bacterium]|nr:hypothetical protein [Gammaproteobacteria bacterium]MCP5198846.1 hypothetical protein [Gammaproteobacteria bacterium]